MNAGDLARFCTKFTVDPSTGCWEWTAARLPRGYGIFNRSTGTGTRLAHRVAYEHFVGPMPKGKELDHRCRNRECVNPEHLEPVTRRENVRRGKKGILFVPPSHCANGHPYDDANSYFSRQANCTDGVRRQCRACKREWMREQRRHTA